MENIRDPFLQKIIAHQKQILPEDPNWLHPEIAPVSKAPMMEAFKKRIMQAVENREKVFVAGDYDCDGIMATSLLVDGFRSLGLETGFYLPNRITEGYGISENTVASVAGKGYSLIVTVDNGVKAFPALEKAKELGVDVIVTDHHVIDEPVEPAVCLVHPDTLEEPFSTLCGAGVAYECLRALGIDKPYHVIWAALASIADCMPVEKQTRAIIQKGLKTLNEQGEKHIRALCKATSINEVTASFQIIPAINAVGRLPDLANPNNMVRFFLSQRNDLIDMVASQVLSVNEKRKDMTAQMSLKANATIKAWQPVLVSVDPSYHEGIIGLVAGQICKEYGKPAMVGTLHEDIVKFSMRSPSGFDCMNFLCRYENYEALGGHANAAGFSVKRENLDDFLEFVKEEGRKIVWTYVEKDPITIELSDISLANIDALEQLRPFGTGFEEPKFLLENPKVLSTYDLSGGKHRKFALGEGVNALNFNQSEGDMKEKPENIAALTGKLSVNEYRGSRSCSFILDSITYKD